MHRSIKEAGLIVAASAVLGFSYTGLTAKGFFAPVGPAVASRSTAAPNIITIEQAKQVYQSGDAIFVDARHGFDFQLGHIRGAVNIPLKDAQDSPDILTILPRDQLLITYCDGEDCNSSITLAAKLDSLGYQNVKVFFGGWKEWQAANLETDKAE